METLQIGLSTPLVDGVLVSRSGPLLDLNFISSTLDPRITFARVAGPVTYLDATGAMQTARTNYLLNSNVPSPTSTGATSVASSDLSAPYGLATDYKRLDPDFYYGIPG